MSKFNNIYSVVVPAESPVFSAHTYSEIYGGDSGCTVTINGMLMDIGPSSSLSLLVRSISGGVGCFLLGDNNDVYQGSIHLGSYSLLDNTINEFVDNDYVEDYFV